MTVWIGTQNNPYTNHLTLSEALLSTFTEEDSDAANASPRWATFNGSAVAATCW